MNAVSPSRRDPFRHPAWLLLVAPVIWLGLWRDLGVPSLHVSDEAAHTAVVRNMLLRDDWLHLFHLEYPYGGKPPLKMWMTAAAMTLLGEEEWVVRLPDALLATGTTLLIWLIGRTYLGGPAPLLAAVAFATAPYLIGVHGLREGVQESPLLFFTTLGSWLFLRGLGSAAGPLRRAPTLGMGVALGAGSLVKSVVAFLLFLPAAAYLVVERRWRDLRSPYTLAAGLLALVMFLWWHAPFLGSELDHNIGGRMKGWRDNSHPPSVYVTWLREGFDPWVWLLVPALALSLVQALRGSRIDRWLLLWGAGSWLPWLFADLKHPWYTYPAYPALALLVARLLLPPELWLGPPWGQRSRPGRAALVLGTLLALAGTRHAAMRAVVIVDSERVEPIHAFSDAVKALPAEARRIGIAIAPARLCADERYYLDLSGAEISYLRGVEDAASLSMDAPHAFIVVPEDVVEGYLHVLREIHDRAWIGYLWPRCRSIYGHRVPGRALLTAAEPSPSLGFRPAPRWFWRDGFHDFQQEADGERAWIDERGIIKVVGGCGTLRLALRTFRVPRRVEIRVPGQDVMVVEVPSGDGLEVSVPVDARRIPGLAVEIVPLTPCTQLDKRCRGISVGSVRYEPAMGSEG